MPTVRIEIEPYSRRLFRFAPCACHRSVLFALIERLKAEVGVLELHVAYLRPDIAEKFA
jgi:hypothetical protein